MSSNPNANPNLTKLCPYLNLTLMIILNFFATYNLFIVLEVSYFFRYPGRPDNGVCPDNVGEKQCFCPNKEGLQEHTRLQVQP